MSSISLSSLFKSLAPFGTLIAASFFVGCATSEISRYPTVKIVNVFEPVGESNVRSSFQLSEGVGLIGTEETGDIYKTEDAGMNWRKVWDGGDVLGIQDVRNYIRAQDGNVYITTTEPGTVVRSTDEGEQWELIAKCPGSRTVGFVQLDDGSMLVGLRRATAGKTSLVRSEDNFKTQEWVLVSEEQPRQNVTCFGYNGGETVYAGVGYEASGKVFKSNDSGRTWSKGADFPDARDLMGIFFDGDDIYALTSGVSKLHKSSDGGKTWENSHQLWEKGFVGKCVEFERNGKTYWVLPATDQRVKPYRHVVMISDDLSGEWKEWIELVQDQSGGASNLSFLDSDTFVVGTGNHSAQGRVFTLKISD
ncbi:MAG: WD40/YVTN/BNR-like repeat-containing protein [Opitutaceae bacterium]